MVTRPVYTLRGVSRSYHVGGIEVPALAGIDLDIDEGDLAVLLGASGSGKSTLVNLLGGLDRPTAGSVRYRGLDLGAASDAELTTYRRDCVGFVFQFYNLVPGLTARENVELVTDLAVNPMTPAEALARVGLEDRLDHFPSQLSGGEQQRVAIARAVAKRPAVLLCDEPTGALDCATGVRVLEALAEANRDLDTTTVIITHNAVIASMADVVLRLSGGRLQSVERNDSPRPPSELTW
ncbi:MAG: ABC transporter ATP-binding protein [Gammaproteobacteria bacterium]|nr:ABC transporter ATP-binding protein [Gammaproteobacteria bacterium]